MLLESLAYVRQNSRSECVQNFRVFQIFWKTYFCELVLGFSPDPNQTSAERFSGQWILIFIKKKRLNFWFTVATGRQNVERGRGTFSKMPRTPERNKISSPNSEHLCKSEKIVELGHLVAL